MQTRSFGEFLRTRRARVQAGDVGITATARRRVRGLRRDEVARLAGVSADYYAEIEQGRGARPSEQVVAALARALRLNRDERDHLFQMAGYPRPRPRPTPRSTRACGTCSSA